MVTVVVAGGGLAAVAALARAARRAAVVDRVRRLSIRTGRLVPGALAAVVARMLHDAALDLTVHVALQTWLLATGGAALAGALLAPAAAPALVVLVGGGMPAALRGARHRRHRRFVRSLPVLVDAVAAHLRAGGTISSALVTLAEPGHPWSADLARVQARVDLGASPAAALSAWADEAGHCDVRAVVGAFTVAREAGGPAAGALEALAASLRDRHAVAAEARALSAQARLSAVVVGGAPLAVLLVTSITDPGGASVLVTTPIGVACLAAGLTLEALAAVWMRRIVRSAP